MLYLSSDELNFTQSLPVYFNLSGNLNDSNSD